MPFLPWAWTSFPVEPENGIAGLAIRGRIGRIRDTVFPEGRSWFARSPAGPQESTSNPGPLRPRITPPDTRFPGFCAKTGALLHTFSGIARYSRFRANRAFYADVQNAFVRFWEANFRVELGSSTWQRKEGLFWGLKITIVFPGISPVIPRMGEPGSLPGHPSTQITSASICGRMYRSSPSRVERSTLRLKSASR